MSEDSVSHRVDRSARQTSAGTAAEGLVRAGLIGRIPGPLAMAKAVAPLAVFAVALLAPSPDGLSSEGQRVIAITALAVVLWAASVLPLAVVGLIAVVLLAATGAVPDVATAIYGFSTPVPYFLIAALTMGMAMQQSGLARRIALYVVRLAGSSRKMLYIQMVLTFSLLSFVLPNAATRISVILPIYEDILARWDVPSDSPLNKGMMMAMGLLNPMASTALIAGGAIPLLASSLLGDFNWTRWFLMMSVPMYANVAVGAAIIYWYYRAGFRGIHAVDTAAPATGPVQGAEIKIGIIVLGTALLWMTDSIHGMHPAIPALIALCVILLPRTGLLSWREFERNFTWSVFFALGASLSLAQALVSTGAAAWLAGILAKVVVELGSNPLLLVLALAIGSAAVRPLISNVSAYLALIIPVAMAIGASMGLNPLVAGLATVIVGGQLIFYAAQNNGTIVLLERANLSSMDLLKLALILSVPTTLILILVAVPYWGLLGEGLAG